MLGLGGDERLLGLTWGDVALTTPPLSSHPGTSQPTRHQGQYADRFGAMFSGRVPYGRCRAQRRVVSRLVGGHVAGVILSGDVRHEKKSVREVGRREVPCSQSAAVYSNGAK